MGASQRKMVKTVWIIAYPRVGTERAVGALGAAGRILLVLWLVEVDGEVDGGAKLVLKP